MKRGNVDYVETNATVLTISNPNKICIYAHMQFISKVANHAVLLYKWAVDDFLISASQENGLHLSFSTEF